MVQCGIPRKLLVCVGVCQQISDFPDIVREVHHHQGISFVCQSNDNGLSLTAEEGLCGWNVLFIHRSDTTWFAQELVRPFPKIVTSALRSFKALCFTGWRFEGSGLDLIRRPTIIVLACCARVETSFLETSFLHSNDLRKGDSLGRCSKPQMFAQHSFYH